MARFTNCKKGLHRYSSAGAVGGGIARRICSECGLVQIDLSHHDQIDSTDLFTERKLATMFEVEALLAQIPADAPKRSFGEAPANRRRPARAFG